MAKDARFAAKTGPPPVTVHDDRKVLWQALGVDRREEPAFGRVGFYDAGKVFMHQQ
jgi:hypothetical protein